MVKEAEKHSSEDKQRKEQAEAKNVADGLTYTAEKALKDAGDKVPADVKKDVEAKVKDIRDHLQSASVEELKQKTQALSDALMKVGQSMYGQQGAGPNPGQAGPNPSGDQAGPNPGQNGQGPTQGNDEPVEGEVVE
jgi:molecular chaperone DnaK